MRTYTPPKFSGGLRLKSVSEVAFGNNNHHQNLKIMSLIGE
ncbi:hypothetical protein BI355_2272 (plasmid) [Companilactobacillus crustorum]|nr:hypothetical protein BI355_2272 [Companilactobacillus crustorum]